MTSLLHSFSSSSSPEPPTPREKGHPSSRSKRPIKRTVPRFRAPTTRLAPTTCDLSPTISPLLSLSCLVNEALSHISRGRGAKLTTYPSPLMLLLILSLFGLASAGTGERLHQVERVNTHLFFLIILMIRYYRQWFIWQYLRYLVRRIKYRACQESDAGLPHEICRPVCSPGSLPLPYRDRAVYPQRRSCDPPVQCSADTTEGSSFSYPADPPFYPSVTSFGGRKSEIAQHYPSPIAVEVRRRENVPISSEMVTGNGLSQSVEETEQRGSNDNEMAFAGNLGREVEVRFPCRSCDDSNMYFSNVNVEPEEMSAPLETIPDDLIEAVLDLDEDLDCPPLFYGAAGYDEEEEEDKDTGRC